MERLTKDDVNQMGMVDLSHNQVFVRNREAWYRDFETEISVRDLAQAMFARNGIEYPSDNEEFDEYMLELLQDGYETLDGMIALYYNALWSMAEVREKLKEYEDLEEQGLLVKLPCKVGDLVWSIDNVMEELTPWCLGFDYWMIPFLNKTIFLTQEQAEKHLVG